MSGFLVLDGAGEFLAWSACILTALLRFREIPKAAKVERCSDGKPMCTAYVRRGRRGAAS